jgi:hypothetical protein
VHASEVGQPLPPVPWQPGTQREVVVSQMRPEVVTPQSESMAHPHEPPATQRAPPRSARQADELVAVHSTHVLVSVEQMKGAAQSASTRHCTQRSAPSVMSQRCSGAVHAPSLMQPPVGSHWPRPPAGAEQVSLVGQPLRPVAQPGSQKPLGPVQTRPESEAPHAASVEQPHRPVGARQVGSAPEHSVASVAEHCVHAPASGPVSWQAGRAGSGQLGAPSAVHAAQVCVVAEHSGVVPPQSSLPRHATHWPPPPDVSQKGAAAPHRLVSVAEHTAHAPVLRHTGNFGSQSALERHERHACVVASHTGVVPAQSENVRHETQLSLATSHTSCEAAQAPGLPVAQGTHAPVASHAGVVTSHSVSAAQARQVCEVASHTGVPPAQSVDATHATHVPVVGAHRGVAPVHDVAFVAEQTPHAPEGWHAGVAPPQSPSATQPRQTCVVPSHTGLSPAHCASARQLTQVPVATAHRGVVPEQAAALVVEHAPHEPLAWQAGVAPPQSASLPQPRQVPVPASHTGFVAPHSAAVVHEAHVPVVASQPATGPVHFVVLVAEHTPQAPLGSQAGTEPPQSVSAPQAWHVCVVKLHTGAAPPHWALVTQPTQVPSLASQVEVVPTQRRAFVAEHWPHAPEGWQAGVVPPQSASAAHARQAWVVVLHAGAVPLQPDVAVHCTHVPVGASHTAVVPVQADVFVAEHAPHEPLRWHAGVVPPPHWTSFAHGRQVCVVPSHTGVVPAQSAFARQRTHVPAAVLHTGVVPTHAAWFVAEHAAHAPLAWQAGVTPPHSPSPAQARHARVPASQTGVVPVHVSAERHPTHVPVTVAHTGVVPAHAAWFVVEQAAHAPDGWQAGVAPPQSASVEHARHTCRATLHVGVVPLQVALDVHATQVAPAGSQAGVEPVQSVAFVAEHSPHDPFAWHAGAAPPQSASAEHARHVRVVASHVGFVPAQSVLTTHETHVAVAGLQTSVAPVHSVVFVVEHTPHAPEASQAGVPPPQSPSLEQARQTCVVVLHTGVLPEQSLFAMHRTQDPEPTSHSGVTPAHVVLFVAEHWAHAPVV